MHALKFLLGVPRILRTDCGTENTNLSFIQPYLRHLHTDCFAGIESFRYGQSVANQVRHNVILTVICYEQITTVFEQRIEAWWSLLKRLCTMWWQEFFKV